MVAGCSGGGTSDTTASPVTVATTQAPVTTAPTLATTTIAPTISPPSPTTTTVATTTTTTVAPRGGGEIPLAAVVASVEAEYQTWWEYYQPDPPRGIAGPVDLACDHEIGLGFGDVVICEAVPLEERENWPEPFLIVILLTGDDGSIKHVEDRGIAAAYAAAPSGQFCRDLIASESELSSYFGAVAYWFREGRPDRMDADRDGIPCETVYPLWDIASFWAGSPLEEVTDIHFGYVTDLDSRSSGFEMTIDYAFFLGGMAANLAAEAAGEIAPGEGVPNDYYIVNENPRLRTFALASDVDVLLQGYRDNIEAIATEPILWMELLEEAARCDAAGWPEDCANLGGDDWFWYGNGYLPYWIQLDGDTVIRVEEQYLP